MLHRLVGLETEYAIRFHPDHPAWDNTVDYQLYHALIQALGRRVITAPAGDLKEGVFFITGGAVWFEFVRFAGGFGLIEGSTPECRGPREMLLHQRAQDLLLSEAARDADVPGVLALVKNDCDSQGRIYGAQENYELTLATGWRLKCWRWGLYLLFPLMLLAWLGYACLNKGLKFYLPMADLFCLVLSPFVPETWANRTRAVLVGDDVETASGYASPIPAWVETVGLGFLRIIAGPLAVGIYVLVRLTAFRQVRRDLLAFLISRPIFAGAGHVDRQGRFQLSDKSWGMNCLLGYNGIVLDRPIFSIGHFFKSLMFHAKFSSGGFSRMLLPKQRLQICLGDSNMAEEAEYLRVGTTLLVLDAMEAGYFPSALRISRPIKSLRAICADPSLQTKVRCKDGQPRTALEIQRHYYAACTRFVAESSEATDEARDILKRWDEVLTLLETAPDELIGRIDWVTKRFLLGQTTQETDDLAIKKKIDIRYHELSPEGYYRQLESTGITRAILTPEEIEQATQQPPQNTPATARSYYLRTFGPGKQITGVNWNQITLGRQDDIRIIDLTDPVPTSNLEPPTPLPDVFPTDPDEKDSRR